MRLEGGRLQACRQDGHYLTLVNRLIPPRRAQVPLIGTTIAKPEGRRRRKDEWEEIGEKDAHERKTRTDAGGGNRFGRLREKADERKQFKSCG